MAATIKLPNQKEQTWQTEKQHMYQNGGYYDSLNRNYYTNAEKDALAKANQHETDKEREQQRVYTQGFKNVNTYKPTVPSMSDLLGKYGSGSGYGSGGINSRANFQPSDAYNQAMAYTSDLLSKLSSGRTQYTDQINSLMDTINNRAAFSYDPDNDPLFQQYLASSMESGKTAMMDTIGQASALTGGYGSTYATAAANGAYNNFVQDAYNNLPEYYQSALDTYNSQTNDLYNKLGMYNTADQVAYNRLADAYGNNLAWANDMYGKEYSNYWDALNYNTQIDQYNADLAYKYAALNQDNEQYYAKLASDLSNSGAVNGGIEPVTDDKLWKTAYADIDRTLEANALDSNELADIIQYYESQGYDGQRLENYARSSPMNKQRYLSDIVTNVKPSTIQSKEEQARAAAAARNALLLGYK